MMGRSGEYSFHRGARTAIAAAILIGLSGCATSTAFRNSVGQFATLTKAGTSAQNARLAAIVADEQERIRADLANNAVDLRLDPACATTETSQEIGPLPPCGLVRADRQPLEQPVPIGNIVALSAALNAYADGLIAVAADSTTDQAAFTTSINNLGTSLGKLEGQVREATGATPGNSRAEIGAVAAAVAEAGNLYFGYRRSRALQQIVLQGDPIVQQAVATLVRVQLRIRQYDRGALAEQVRIAQQAASLAAGQLRAARQSNPQAPATALRTAQNALYAALAAYNASGSEVPKYQAIGDAHRALAEAARAGASPEQMAAAITAIMHLAGTIHDSVETLEGDSGSN
jgi:hypothetical protein